MRAMGWGQGRGEGWAGGWVGPPTLRPSARPSTPPPAPAHPTPPPAPHPCLAQQHGVDGLQVAGVGQQGHVDAAAAHGGAVVRRPQMVLDVAGAAVLRAFPRPHARELGKYLGHGFAHHVGQHGQAAAVRHAEHNGVHAQLGRAVDHGLHARDQGLRALQSKPLGGRVLGGEEGLEHFGPSEAVQDVGLGGWRGGAGPTLGRPAHAPKRTPGNTCNPSRHPAHPGHRLRHPLPALRAAENLKASGVSMRSRSQLHRSRSGMCMYS